MSSLQSQINRYLGNPFILDLRSLAIFRIGLGLTALTSILYRWPDLFAFYSDSGILPRTEAMTRINDYSYSILFASGNTTIITIIFLLGAVVAFALMVGYKTKYAHVATWIFMISLYNRNTLINDNGDLLLNLALFIGMFLPLDQVFSVDSWGRKLKNYDYSSGITMLLIVQIAIVYGFSVLYKYGEYWHIGGDALYYALHLDQFRTVIGDALLRFPKQILGVLTGFVVIIEIIAPFILFLPLFPKIMKLIASILLVMLNIGIATNLEIGVFPLINTFLAIALLPDIYWDLHYQVFGKLQRVVHKTFNIVFIPPEINTVAGEVRSSTLLNVFGVAATCYLIFANLATLPKVDYTMPHTVENIVSFLGVRQRWNMFSPHPPSSDGWYIITANRHDGSVIDVITREDPTTEKTIKTKDRYGSAKWVKFFEAASHSRGVYLENYAKYTCLRWFNDNYEKLKSIDITYVSESPSMDGYTLEESLKDYECVL